MTPHYLYLFVVTVCVCVCLMDFCAFLFVAAALALCKHCLAQGNATEESANRTVSHCHLHGNRNNCTGRYDQGGEGRFLCHVINGWLLRGFKVEV